jgi:hypothetical protein
VICYIHLPGAMTPRLRFLSDSSREEMLSVLHSTLLEWLDFERAEIYDERDRPLVKHNRSHAELPLDV